MTASAGHDRNMLQSQQLYRWGMPDLLPKFTAHEGHTKLEALGGPGAVTPFVRDFLEDYIRDTGRLKRDVKVLDVGCGRGDTVAWLCEQGWDAHGVDVDERYLEQGRPYLERTGHGAARIQMCSNHYPFPDQQFDIVLSDQVIEHVADLDKLFREVARVSRVGALGLHIFPARWRPVESHLLTPLVHWLPKGRTRRLVLRSLLAIGLAAPYFKDRSLKDRVEIFGAYSDSETFYRSLGELRRVCVQHGLQPDMSKIVAAKISRRLPGVPQALLPMASLLYRHAFSVILQTVRCEGTH